MPFRFVPTRQNTRAELFEVFFETVVNVIMVYFSIVGIMVGIAASPLFVWVHLDAITGFKNATPSVTLFMVPCIFISSG